MITLVEVEAEEMVCEGCQSVIPNEEEFYFTDPHGGKESGYYCDECIPYCYCAECGNEWF